MQSVHIAHACTERVFVLSERTDLRVCEHTLLDPPSPSAGLRLGTFASVFYAGCSLPVPLDPCGIWIRAEGEEKTNGNV